MTQAVEVMPEGHKPPGQGTEIVETPPQQPIDTSVESFIAQALATKAPIDVLERLLAMRTQLKAEVAKEAFDAAMADFQGECPVIERRKEGGKTKGGEVAYMYAPLEHILPVVRPLLQKHGFSYTFKTETKPAVRVTCIVKHKMGHSEESTMESPLGTKTPVMSDSQVTAAAVTFNKRYAFINAFGIVIGGEDNETKLPQSQATPANGGVTTEIATYRNMLQATKNQQELATVWNTVPNNVRRALIGIAGQMKKKFAEFEKATEGLTEEEKKQIQIDEAKAAGVKTGAMATPEEQQAFLDKEGVEGIPL